MESLASELRAVVAVEPTAAALEYKRRWYSWRDLSTSIERIDALLSQAGIGPDGRVGILIRNRPGQLFGILAVLATDRCLVTLSPLLPDDKMANDIEAVRAPVIIGEAEDLARPAIAAAIRRVGAAVIEVGVDIQQIRLVPGQELPTGPDLLLDGPDVAIEMLTSGTTGLPKRIPLTRDSFNRSFAGAIFYERDRKPGMPAQLRPGTLLLSGPLNHIGGIYTALTCLVGGRKACLLERFTVPEWHDAVIRHRPAVTAVVPAGLRMILDANIPREDLASLKALRTGTAPLDPAVAEEFLDRYGLPILQTYGATEFAGAIAGWTLAEFRTHWAEKRGSVGRIHADVEARVIDPETGATVAPGMPGLLELRAPQLGDAQQWKRTTDRVTIDADGFLFVHGRSDNAINRGGFKIHPDDVVKALEQHPSVREAVVTGIADARLGEVPVAAIMLREGMAAPDVAELTAFARQHLLPYQVPVAFRIVADVPRTPSMKPSLPELRRLFEEAAT